MNSALSYHIRTEKNDVSITILNCNEEISDYLKKEKTFRATNDVLIVYACLQNISIIKDPSAPKLQVMITGFHGDEAGLYDTCTFWVSSKEEQRDAINDIIQALHDLKCAAYGHVHSPNSCLNPPTVIWAE